MDENRISYPVFIKQIWHSEKPGRQKNKANPVHGSSAAEYCERFNKLGDLFAIVNSKKEQLGHPPSVLDVMSDLSAIRGLDVSGGVAIELGKSIVQTDDNTRNLHQLNDDIRRKVTWEKLDQIMQENGFKTGFDIVMCSGVGGMGQITDNPNIHFFLLQQFYKRLSSEGGLILTEVPESSSYIVREWVRFIEENYKKRIEVKLRESPSLGREHNLVLAIIRQPEAPGVLPANFTAVDIDRLYKKGLFDKNGVLCYGEAPGLIEKHVG